jgi:hypothetical protein
MFFVFLVGFDALVLDTLQTIETAASLVRFLSLFVHFNGFT